MPNWLPAGSRLQALDRMRKHLQSWRARCRALLESCCFFYTLASPMSTLPCLDMHVVQPADSNERVFQTVTQHNANRGVLGTAVTTMPSGCTSTGKWEQQLRPAVELPHVVAPARALRVGVNSINAMKNWIGIAVKSKGVP